jgi:hypothetical protein
MLDMVAKDLDKEVDNLSEADKDIAHDQYLAVALILVADKTRFGKLIDKLQNDYLQ